MKSRFLKWGNNTVGTINDDMSVDFFDAGINRSVASVVGNTAKWSPAEFYSFLCERIVSKSRRDIEHILHRCGLLEYNAFDIADITHAINASDLFWTAENSDDDFESAMTEVFNNIFKLNIDAKGNTIDTPEGQNIKRYGVYNGRYGIFKKRLAPVCSDTESEIACYKLALNLGISCCPVYKADDNTIFSQFEYNFGTEFIVHMRHILKHRSEDTYEYQNILNIRPQYKNDILKTMILDYITYQDDRHLSNIAVKYDKNDNESFYPLYDNGRSLFYNETSETMDFIVKDKIKNAPSFGFIGTYYDQILELISNNDIPLDNIININLTKNDIHVILKESGIKGEHLYYCLEWAYNTYNIIININNAKNYFIENKLLQS